MGSRLKGRGKKKERPDWRVKKLVVYGGLILAVLGILWYLYLWEWNPERDTPHRKDGETTESTGGNKP
jgi:hypothetical protein